MIGRNDNCHCGSGKKYKKCCLKKDQSKTVLELKERHELNRLEECITELTTFINTKVSSEEIQRLTTEYCTIFDSDPTNPILEGIVASYITMVHTFENGLRGIEWYLQENPDADELLVKMAAQKLRMIKIIETTNITTTIQDLNTNEIFTVEREALTMPWGIMQAIILPRMKGHSLFLYKHFPAPPNYLDRLEVMPKNHLDLLHAIFINHDIIIEDIEVSEAKGTVNNKENFLSEMKANEDVLIDEAGKVHVLETTYEYNDNVFEKAILLGKKLATIAIEDNVFTATVFGTENKERFCAWVAAQPELSLTSSLETVNNEDNEHLVIISFGNARPEHATSIFTRMLYQATNPLQTFGGKSLLDIVNEGNTEEAEKFLQKLEYYSFTDFLQYGVTPDFSTLRKELGLATSSFVSRKKTTSSRESEIKVVRTIELPTAVAAVEVTSTEATGVVAKFIEELELSAALSGHEHAEKIASFYYEKTDGKAKSTQQKYKKALFEICSALEATASIENSIALKTADESISATQQKNIESVGKTLLKYVG